MSIIQILYVLEGYNGGSNTEHLNSEPIQNLNILKIGNEMVWFRNGWDYSCRTDHSKTGSVHKKQDGVHLCSNEMVGLSSIKIEFKHRTIWHPTSY